MSQFSEETLGTSASGPRLLPLLVVLFIASGCSALIYEIVWLQMLQLVIGSSAVSLGVLLGTFMGGMCIGSLLLPRFISTQRHPLRVYAVLEGIIGCLGLALFFCMPIVSELYAGNGLTGLPGVMLRGLIAGLCLLPPTIMMGATLPAIARWVRGTPEGVSWLGFFYAGNIVGAVFGCLLAAFYLMRIYDIGVTTYVAVSINLIVAVASYAMASWVPYLPAVQPEAEAPAETPSNEAVFAAIAISGATALGAEVIWTRLLSLMLGTTVYTFAIILAVFLVGLGLGSGLGSFVARFSPRPRIALGICQLLLTGAIAWAAFMVAHSLPYWPIDATLSSDFWDRVPVDVARCLCVSLPATMLWGASFPLAIAAAARGDKDFGRLVGRVYAANTIGGIVGAIVMSVFLIGTIGTQQSHRVLIGMSALATILAFAPLLQGVPARGRFAVAASVLAAMVLIWSVDGPPARLIAYGHYPPTYFPDQKIIFTGEGINASIAISERDDGVRTYHSSGRTEAGNDHANLRVQRMLGHMPALIHANPKSILIVGCGTGITAGSFVLHPAVERIVICDFEPLVPATVPTYFKEDNYDVINDPRVEIIRDDARNYLLSTQEKFDVITSDPFEPCVKGVASLYTLEHFELIKRHLNPGGIVTQYVPIYENSIETVKSGFATFFAAFSDGTVWVNDHDGFLPDLVLMGTLDQEPINLEALKHRWKQKDHADIVKSMEDVGLGTPYAMLATYGGRACDLTGWLENAQLNRDRNLRLQYLAGMYSDEGHLSNIEMLSYRKFPDSLFVGTLQEKHALRMAFDQAAGLTAEEKETFESTIAEIEQFGTDHQVMTLVNEVWDIYVNGSWQEKKDWLQRYVEPALTHAEQAAFDAYVKDLKTKKEQEDERRAWDESSLAARRYFLRFIGGEQR